MKPSIKSIRKEMGPYCNRAPSKIVASKEIQRVIHDSTMNHHDTVLTVATILRMFNWESLCTNKIKAEDLIFSSTGGR